MRVGKSGEDPGDDRLEVLALVVRRKEDDVRGQMDLSAS
jgi:hypothetical protein